MQKFSEIRPTAKLYVSAVVLVGLGAALHSIVSLLANPVGPEWLVLAALTLFTGSFTIKVPSITARISVSETFVFASVLLFGAAAGTLTVLLETLVISLWANRQSRSHYRAMFNVAAPAVSIWTSSTLFFAFSGIAPYSIRFSPLAVLFAPLAALTIVYFLLNSWLVAIALGLEKQQSAYEIWRNNFTWLSVNYFSGASVAALIVTYAGKLEVSVLIIIVPLLVVSYLTFRTAMGRVEDTNQHLNELNRLYLSTVETLAMAVDAKDQVTHGHIRRVQAQATRLAMEVGVRDEKLLKAIEAAALLHDMGKLAVPEYILNKPGRLSGAEFEKMKLHASVGADILSAIDFPYPVVPIVRHHHENWDGTGYPDKISGTQIPIGARILAVVDCFDALTSDRPYRLKLSDEDAIGILLERRGSMYDPLIVDSFVKVHTSSPLDAVRKGPPSDVLNTIARATRPALPVRSKVRQSEVTPSALEALPTLELVNALLGQSLEDSSDVVLTHLGGLLPCSLCVFYRYDSAKDELEAKHASGDSAVMVRGLKIALGQRLSGWVAANRHTIVNSDPALDFGDVARAIAPQLGSCLSTPLVLNDELVGVLSVYSAGRNAFSDDDRRTIEILVRQLEPAFRRAIESNAASRGDSVDATSVARHA